MKDEDTDYQNLKKAVNQYMDRQVADTDDELQDRFTLARRRALDAIPGRSGKPAWLLPVSLAGVVVTGFVLFTLLWLMPSRESPGEDLDTLLTLENNDDFEMLQNELEFYVWLEWEEQAEKG